MPRETTKIVILARGLGTRMRADSPGTDITDAQRAAAEAGLKAMMPIDRPFLDYCLSAYADAGYTHACLVIGPEHSAVRDYYQNLPTERITITTAIQQEPLGTADAVLAAETFVAGDRFAMVNGDNYYPAEVMRAVGESTGNVVVGFERGTLLTRSNIPADRVRAFALLVANQDGTLADLVEKPDDEQYAALAPRATISMNCFGFTPEIFQAARTVQPSPRGELEIVDAVRTLARSHTGVTVLPIEAGVLDLSNRHDIDGVTQHLMDTRVRL